MDFIEPCFGIGHNLSLICQMTSEDIKHQLIKKKDFVLGSIIWSVYMHLVQVIATHLLRELRHVLTPVLDSTEHNDSEE